MKTAYRIQIFFEESHKQTRPDIEQATKWLISKGYRISNSYYPDTFFVHFEGDIEEKDVFQENLDFLLLAMSERNSSDCALLITGEFQGDENFGTHTWGLVPPSEQGLEYFKKITDSEDLLNKLKELRLFYSQVESRAKLIYGVSLLEKWFDTKPEHCLSLDEKKEVIKKIEELNLSDEKKGRLKKGIEVPNFFAKKTRNLRIAEAIFPYFPELNIEGVEDKVRKLYRLRGNAAHSTLGETFHEQLGFLKSIFRRYIHEEYDFFKINLH
jgi:hypothetical protein